MPLKKLVLRAGINREGTSYSNEDGFYISEKVRFRSGYAEKIGGWINQISSATFDGVAKSLFLWSDLYGLKLLAMGTNQKFYIQSINQYHDITPTNLGVTDVEYLDANPITYYSNTGADRYKLIIHHVAHGRSAGDFATIVTSAYYGITLNGKYEVVEVIDADNYTISIYPLITNFSSPASQTGGGVPFVNPASVLYDISSGNCVNINDLTGYNSGGYDTAGYGETQLVTGSAGDQRLWSQSNFDQDLMFAYRNGPIFWWTKDTTTYARAIYLRAYVNNSLTTLWGTKASTKPTSSATASSIPVADNTGINGGAQIYKNGVAFSPPAYVASTYQSNAGFNVPVVQLTDGVTSSTSIPYSITFATTDTLSFGYSFMFTPTKTLEVDVSSVNGFAIAFGTNSYNPTNPDTELDPMLVRWSDQDKPVEWIPEITNQSGEQRLTNGSYIVTHVITRQEILIWTDSAIYSMQYLGPPYVWGINILLDNLSIASQNAKITVNNVTYWMGMDKFYTYSGRVETLACALRQHVFGNINRDQMTQIVCGANEGYNEVWWFYPSADSPINNKYVIYNHLENIWYYGSLERSFWLDNQLNNYPIAAYSQQNTYVSIAMDAATTTNTINAFNCRSLPESGMVLIGSEKISYTGNTGVQLTGCTRAAAGTTIAAHPIYSTVTNVIPNQIMNHEYGYDDLSLPTPTAIVAYLESADFDIEDGLNFSYVWRVIPDLSFAGSTATSPRCYLTVKVRQNSGSEYTIDQSDPTGNPYDSQLVTRTATSPVEQYTGQVYVRVRGRQMAFEIRSTDIGVFWQMGMMRIDVRQDGRR